MISGYYTSTQVDNALASYLTSSSASSTYLTQSNAASIYLTQSSASSTYLSLSGGTMSGTLIAPRYSYTTAQTKYLMLSSHDFSPIGDITVTINALNQLYKTGGVDNYVYASVDLPDNATVISVRVFFYDNDAANSISTSLYKFYLDTGASSTMADPSSPNGCGWT